MGHNPVGTRGIMTVLGSIADATRTILAPFVLGRSMLACVQMEWSNMGSSKGVLVLVPAPRRQ